MGAGSSGSIFQREIASKNTKHMQYGERRWLDKKPRPRSWVYGAAAYLKRLAKWSRAIGDHHTAQDAAMAWLILHDCYESGEPGLSLGMFYTPDWRMWKDVTAQERSSLLGAPSAADLDAVAAEERAATATEKAEAK
jgi:hypothetical protein